MVSATTTDAARVGVLEAIFRPVVRFCLRNRISIHLVDETLRRVFVETATKQLEAAGEKATVSRIYLMTGLNRRDVTRIVYGDAEKQEGPDLLVQVLAVWENKTRYLTKSGTPRVLTYDGEDSEFKQLVSAVSQNVSPATVLMELERIGAVTRTDHGVKMVQGVGFWEAKPDKALSLLSRDFDTIARAAEENLEGVNETKNVYLRTEFDNISREDLPRIRKWLFDQGISFHKKARAFLARYDNDLNPSLDREGGARVVLSAFSWTGVESLSQETSQLSDAAKKLQTS